MLQEIPVIPHTWTQWFWLVVATVLGYVGSSIKEWISKRRSPAEELKTQAEARQIDTATNLTLMQAASEALTKACRLQDERDHWQRKAESLAKDLELANMEVHTADLQMRRLSAFITAKDLHHEFLKLDAPKEK